MGNPSNSGFASFSRKFLMKESFPWDLGHEMFSTNAANKTFMNLSAECKEMNIPIINRLREIECQRDTIGRENVALFEEKQKNVWYKLINFNFMINLNGLICSQEFLFSANKLNIVRRIKTAMRKPTHNDTRSFNLSIFSPWQPRKKKPTIKPKITQMSWWVQWTELHQRSFKIISLDLLWTLFR